jgi:hypothetical protein
MVKTLFALWPFPKLAAQNGLIPHSHQPIRATDAGGKKRTPHAPPTTKYEAPGLTKRRPDVLTRSLPSVANQVDMNPRHRSLGRIPKANKCEICVTSKKLVASELLRWTDEQCEYVEGSTSCLRCIENRLPCGPRILSATQEERKERRMKRSAVIETTQVLMLPPLPMLPEVAARKYPRSCQE